MVDSICLLYPGNDGVTWNLAKTTTELPKAPLPLLRLNWSITCWLICILKDNPCSGLSSPLWHMWWKNLIIEIKTNWENNDFSRVLWSISRIATHNWTMQIFCYAPAYSKNSGRALSVTPVRPVRPYVHLSVRPSVRLSVCTSHFRVRAIAPKPYGIYSWNFTGAYITIRRCVMNKEDNSCIFVFLIISPWLNSI